VLKSVHGRILFSRREQLRVECDKSWDGLFIKSVWR